MFAGYSWEAVNGKRLLNSQLSGGLMTSLGSTACLSSCAANVDCDSFNFRPTDNTCELNTHQMGARTSNIVDSPDWIWWKTSFDTVVWSWDQSISWCSCAIVINIVIIIGLTSVSTYSQICLSSILAIVIDIANSTIRCLSTVLTRLLSHQHMHKLRK